MKQLLACLLLGSCLQHTAALDAATSAATPSTAPAREDARSEPVPNRRNALSPDLSHAVTAGIRYEPAPAPKSEEELVDLRDIDKPKNQIIRLPRFVVEAKRPPVFTERNLYSKEMLRRLAYQRYVSAVNRDILNRFRLPIIGGGIDAYANRMYEDEEREKNMTEFDDRVAMYRVSGDEQEARSLEDDAKRTFMRRSDLGIPIRK